MTEEKVYHWCEVCAREHETQEECNRHEQKALMEPLYPDHYICEGCSAWDSVNGCWNDCREYGDENCIAGTEDGPYDEQPSACEEEGESYEEWLENQKQKKE